MESKTTKMTAPTEKKMQKNLPKIQKPMSTLGDLPIPETKDTKPAKTTVTIAAKTAKTKEVKPHTVVYNMLRGVWTPIATGKQEGKRVYLFPQLFEKDRVPAIIKDQTELQAQRFVECLYKKETAKEQRYSRSTSRYICIQHEKNVDTVTEDKLEYIIADVLTNNKSAKDRCYCFIVFQYSHATKVGRVFAYAASNGNTTMNANMPPWTSADIIESVNKIRASSAAVKKTWIGKIFASEDFKFLLTNNMDDIRVSFTT